MSSPHKLTSAKIAAQLHQMQEQLLAAQEEERIEAERVAEEKARREAEEWKKREEKEIAEKKRRIEEAKRAKKKLEEDEKKRQAELAEARKGKAREVVPSQKRMRDDILDPADPPYQEESMDDSSERDEELRAPKKKRKGNNAQPIASTSSARPACARCVDRELDCCPQDQSNTVSCYHCRKSKVHCSWNDRIKSNPIVGDASQPMDFYERVVGAMEGIQDSMPSAAVGPGQGKRWKCWK
ncbi:hypothetical protein F5890DRAFT_1478356 [Lentinula detonsa]|uniref:Zn(2)-C6 fungal-type domain-containing protein n=1 Tax=Lentinula detonsa TaxID=2804962 RepID=A0AA38PPU7_9AGAR|nr:hypothetical protein F5890DRAFT_1478356 [Lentinula detonsa]